MNYVLVKNKLREPDNAGKITINRQSCTMCGDLINAYIHENLLADLVATKPKDSSESSKDFSENSKWLMLEMNFLQTCPKLG